jgi:hypothetical protein
VSDATKGGGVHEQPEPTEEEQEQAPERVPEEEAKSALENDRPEPVQPEDRG